MKLDRLLIPGLAGMFILGIFTGRLTAPEPRLEEQPKARAKLPLDTDIRSSNTKHVVSTSSGVSLFESVSASRFEQMARTAAASSDAVENESMLIVLASEWAKKDPRAAIAFAQELKRSDLAYEGLLQWAQHSPDEALRWIEQNESNAGQQRYLTMAVYKGMAKADPQGTVGLVERMPAGAQRDELMAITIDEWAKQDVHKVFDWLETAEITPQFSNIYSQVMGRYIEQDPITAAALISEMAYCDNKVSFASQVAVKLAEQNVDHALEWVKTLDDDNAKKYALQGVIDKWSKGEKADTALDYVMTNDGDPDFKNLFTTVAINLSHRNSELLIEAFDQMDEAQQIISAQQLASVFSVDNPDRGIDWVRSLAPGTVKDTAITSTLRSYKNTNVAEAFELSEIISDDSIREDQIRDVLIAWVPVDQLAAEQALNASSAIVPSEKENLLNGVYQKLKPSDYVLPAKP